MQKVYSRDGDTVMCCEWPIGEFDETNKTVELWVSYEDFANGEAEFHEMEEIYKYLPQIKRDLEVEGYTVSAEGEETLPLSQDAYNYMWDSIYG